MSNEFYCVNLDSGVDEFFKNKDNAYARLWQEYLNCCGDESEEQMQEAQKELYELNYITGIGILYVFGFED